MKSLRYTQTALLTYCNTRYALCVSCDSTSASAITLSRSLASKQQSSCNVDGLRARERKELTQVTHDDVMPSLSLPGDCQQHRKPMTVAICRSFDELKRQ